MTHPTRWVILDGFIVSRRPSVTVTVGRITRMDGRQARRTHASVVVNWKRRLDGVNTNDVVTTLTDRNGVTNDDKVCEA